VRLSYLASFSVVVLGISFGWFASSINTVIQWIVSALWAGYTASNVLKWSWWRFNGYGYFWGMATGMAGSLITFAFPHVHPLNLFPIILGLALIGCIVGTLRTKPEDDAVLMDFYKHVNPWGFWGPIREKVMREDPSFKPNPDFARDMFNIVVGIAWQTSLIAFPVYIVIRRYEIAAWAIAVVVVTSITLKFTWYDISRRWRSHQLEGGLKPARDFSPACSISSKARSCRTRAPMTIMNHERRATRDERFRQPLPPRLR
jgi:hypothetical protein